MIKIDPYEVKINHVPLTEAEKCEMFIKQKNQDCKRALKKRLHEMNKSEKRTKNSPDNF